MRDRGIDNASKHFIKIKNGNKVEVYENTDSTIGLKPDASVSLNRLFVQYGEKEIRRVISKSQFTSKRNTVDNNEYIVLHSRDIDGLKIEYEIVDKKFRNPLPKDESNEKVLAREILSNKGKVMYKDKTMFLTRMRRELALGQTEGSLF
jgi:hypothetical protein